ncbi:hypothetical protein [Thioclava sp.]|uniref:hypothetical protein n=1 Tax=Thioclava sp. TaxID=1933450 RepID=UPI003AA9B73D
MSFPKQTIARIGFALSAMGALAWLLWPRSTGFSLEPEPLFTFLTALAVWGFTEFKTSEEFVRAVPSTGNDIARTRELAAYHRFQLRHILHDQDLGAGIEPRYLSEAGMLLHEMETGAFFFHNSSAQTLLDSFKQSLSAFVCYFSLHSTPERYGSVTLQHVIPYRTKISEAVPQRHYNEIEESNRLASLAWGDFDALVGWLRENVVEAFDVPLEQVWRAKPDIYSDE